MNRISELTLKVLKRKIYPLFFKQQELPIINIPEDIEGVNQMIFDGIIKGDPFMVARFGSTEMCAIANYVGVRDNPHSVIKYIKGEINEWWWNMRSINQLQSHSGFFPVTIPNVIKFGELMSCDCQEIDILGSWCREEYYLRNELKNAKKVNLEDIRPNFYWDGKAPCWTQALRGKRVLLVHPFTETIKTQYAKRSLLFPNQDFLPEFTLLTVKSVQSLGGNNQFQSWFEALDYMKSEMDKVEYDICIIGCGAYGLPLAAHAKRTGHVAIHLGGITQLLFGIRGNRWDSQEYWKPLFNEYWVRPGDSDKPKNANDVEGACYW